MTVVWAVSTAKEFLVLQLAQEYGDSNTGRINWDNEERWKYD